jgi:hypothetical protein
MALRITFCFMLVFGLLPAGGAASLHAGSIPQESLWRVEPPHGIPRHAPPSLTNRKEEEDGAQKEYEELEKDLQSLIEELKELEKDAREKIQRDVIPRLKEEIQRLRKWLREWELKEDAPDTKKIQTETPGGLHVRPV